MNYHMRRESKNFMYLKISLIHFPSTINFCHPCSPKIISNISIIPIKYGPSDTQFHIKGEATVSWDPLENVMEAATFWRYNTYSHFTKFQANRCNWISEDEDKREKVYSMSEYTEFQNAFFAESSKLF